MSKARLAFNTLEVSDELVVTWRTRMMQKCLIWHGTVVAVGTSSANVRYKEVQYTTEDEYTTFPPPDDVFVRSVSVRRSQYIDSRPVKKIRVSMQQSLPSGTQPPVIPSHCWERHNGDVWKPLTMCEQFRLSVYAAFWQLTPTHNGVFEFNGHKADLRNLLFDDQKLRIKT